MTDPTVSLRAARALWLRDLLLDRIQFHIWSDATAEAAQQVIDDLAESDEYDTNVGAFVQMPKWCSPCEAQAAVDQFFAAQPAPPTEDTEARARMRYVIRSSYGNDSIALIQWALESGLKDVTVAYSDTGWATDEWKERVVLAEAWVRSRGFRAVTIPSVGFEQNVFDQTETGMWPTGQRKHCTKYLKVLPSLAWLKQADPECLAAILVGVRRAESIARRNKPAFMLEADEGRHVLHPLIDFSDEDRDAMVGKTPIPLLPHKSDECAICIHANREDLRRAPEEFLARVESMEHRTGRPMFNPAKHMGAVGIRETRKWADSEPGKYKRPDGEQTTEEPIEPATCEDDYCGL